MKLFRSMREGLDGLPEVGPGGRLLGVRPGNVPNPDVVAVDLAGPISPGDGASRLPLRIPPGFRGIAGRQALAGSAKTRYGGLIRATWDRTCSFVGTVPRMA